MAEGYALTGSVTAPADCHLAPMIVPFVRVDEGRQALLYFPVLSRWCEEISFYKRALENRPKPIRIPFRTNIHSVRITEGCRKSYLIGAGTWASQQSDQKDISTHIDTRPKGNYRAAVRQLG